MQFTSIFLRPEHRRGVLAGAVWGSAEALRGYKRSHSLLPTNANKFAYLFPHTRPTISSNSERQKYQTLPSNNNAGNPNAIHRSMNCGGDLKQKSPAELAK
ncbi:UNVERIFIED_CONTAM: hypothetical protein Slati_0561100 [Sesamum latifolium]|uniref:Uncharacterized protein n=1 Tax=Sesamum latifolium TaxID=2727402 RepID=A0AAW2XZ59_9LAMI